MCVLYFGDGALPSEGLSVKPDFHQAEGSRNLHVLSEVRIESG
jgi:hypothetical protein